MSGRERRLRGVVVHLSNFGDAHRVVELFTSEQGRIAAVAKNARASRRRFGGVLDLFAELDCELTATRGLWALDSVALVDAHLGIRASLEAIERASALCELVRVLCAEHQAAPDAFRALCHGLTRLAAGELARATEAYPRLLAAAGISPNLASCVRCGHRGVLLAGVDARQGGLLCQACSPDRRPLSAEAVAVLGGGACTDEATARAVEACTLEWVEAETGRRLRTRTMGSVAGSP